MLSFVCQRRFFFFREKKEIEFFDLSFHTPRGKAVQISLDILEKKVIHPALHLHPRSAVSSALAATAKKAERVRGKEHCFAGVWCTPCWWASKETVPRKGGRRGAGGRAVLLQWVARRAFQRRRRCRRAWTGNSVRKRGKRKREREHSLRVDLIDSAFSGGKKEGGRGRRGSLETLSLSSHPARTLSDG